VRTNDKQREDWTNVEVVGVDDVDDKQVPDSPAKPEWLICTIQLVC